MTTGATSSLLAGLPALDPDGAWLGIVVRLLPQTISLAVIPAAAAIGGALFALAGIARHASGERVARLVLAGNLVGAAIGVVAFVAALATRGLR